MLKITTTKMTGWRAAYLYKEDKQIAHLGINAYSETGMVKPQVFARMGERLFRWNLPHLKWKVNASTLYNKAYQFQDRMIYSLDVR
jgi:hypothetical protein